MISLNINNLKISTTGTFIQGKGEAQDMEFYMLVGIY